MANLGFIIDNRRCIGCHACTVACKSEHDVPVGVNRTWVKYIEKGQFPHSRRLFSVMRCNHCDSAPCVEICPVTALFHRNDGIVDFDNRRCIGCKACMQACPYDALYIDPQTRTAAKCNYCAHRIDQGLEPACVIVCPTQAIISGDLDDPNSKISQTRAREPVTARRVEKGTQPALFYIDGDDASLDPTATQLSGVSMWGGQERGVGHYAPAIDDQSERSAESEQSGGGSHPLDQLRNLLDLGESGETVLVPDPNDAKQLQKAGQVRTETARRAYDSPNKGVLWGWQVTSYVCTKAIAAGVVLLPAFALLTGTAFIGNVIVWLAAILSLCFLGLTGYLLTMDLDQPNRFLYVLLRPQWRSWLVRGAYIISGFAVMVVAWPIVRMFGVERAMIVHLWLLIPLGILTAVYTAFLFAQAKGRDFWQSPLLAVHMLVHSIIAGSAVFALLLPLFMRNTSWIFFISVCLGSALAIKLLVDWFELAITHSTKDARAVARMITRGRYQKQYWIGVVIVGCALPLMISFTASAWLMPIGGILALIGLYIAEHIWIRAPQNIPLS